MILSDYGIHAFLSSLDDSDSFDTTRFGRVLAEHRGAYTLITGQGEVMASLSGTFRSSLVRSVEYPAVGDWVVLSSADIAHGIRIESLLTRTTANAQAPGASYQRAATFEASTRSEKQAECHIPEAAQANKTSLICNTVELAIDSANC